MKKLKIISLVLGLSVMFAACSNGGGGGDIERVTNISINADNIIEITPENLTVDVPEEYQNKKAFLLAINNTNETLDVIKKKYQNSIQSNSVNDIKPLAANKYFSIPANLPVFNTKFTVDLQSARAANTDSTPVTYNLGEKKDFYGFDAENKTQKFAENAELKAIGNHCRIWYKQKDGINLVDENGQDVTDFLLQKLADKFDSIFEKETFIFGSNIPTKRFSELIDFSKCDKIEIIVYDLLDNYIQEKEAGGGIYGYFTETDFYNQKTLDSQTSSAISNECEALHIDSYWLSQTPEAVISTAAHEFQHLLHCVNKTVNSAGLNRSETWFNEMMSMVCEDIMQSQLGISDEGSPKKRLPFFNCNYFQGFKIWRDRTEDNESDVYNSYANAYVFGAYLLRNYGIDFIKELAQNEYINEEAITKALNAVNANENSYDKVFSNFYNVIVNPNGTKFTLNKAVSKTYNINGKQVTFKVDAINLMNVKSLSAQNISQELSDILYNCPEDTDYYGPLLFDGSFVKILDPSGIFVTYVGTGSESFDFSRLDKIDFNTNIAYYVVFID